MEVSGSMLSQAAQRILAVLRAQTLGEPGCNQLARSGREMERFKYSRGESRAPSSWNQLEGTERDTDRQSLVLLSGPPDSSLSSLAASGLTSQTYYRCSQTYSHSSRPEPPASLSGQAPSCSQPDVPEAESSFWHGDGRHLSLQMPDRPSEPQHTTCRNSAGGVWSSFIINTFPDEEGPDEVWASTAEQPSSHKQEPAGTCHSISSDTQCEEKTLWNISTSEPGDTVASGSRLKSKQHLFRPAGGKLHQQQASEAVQTTRGCVAPSGFVAEVLTVTETAARVRREGPPLLCEPAGFVLETHGAHDPEGVGLMEITVELEAESRTKAGSDESTEHEMETSRLHGSDAQLEKRRRETDHTEGSGRKGEHREALLVPPLGCEGKSRSAGPPHVLLILQMFSDHREHLKVCWRVLYQDFSETLSLWDAIRLASGEFKEACDGERCVTAAFSQGCGTRPPGFRPACLLGNRQRHATVQGTNGSSRGTKSSMIAAGLNCSTQDLASAAAGPCNNLEKQHLPPAQSQSRHPLLTPKRKHDALQSRHADPPPKLYQTRPPPWEPPRFSQERATEGEAAGEMRRAQEPPAKISCCETGYEMHAESQTKWAKCRTDPATNGPEGSREVVKSNEPQCQLQTGWLPASLIFDARVKDCGKLNPEERTQMLEKAGEAKVLVLTMVYRDGTTQLDPEQKLPPPVCGLLVLMKSDAHCSTPEDSLGPNDSLIYLKLEHTPPWAQQQTHHAQELFTRDMLLQILSRSQLVVCYKAKDFLRSALQFYRRDLSWKQVAGVQIQDPQVSGWLLDPSDPSSCYSHLLHKHCNRSSATPAGGAQKISQIISGLHRLYKLNMKLCSKLQSQGLWELFSDMELNMIPVLAATESHRIHVDKEALKRTSDLLGAKMKQLEQEAHRAAGQIFLVTSNTQLRIVLFEKLRLHERCENKKLPKTTNKQQQSTSEAALLQLQDLHPLPKIILEYRQVHKIKSTFVDGILSCMKSKNHISSTWYQTSVVTGRISSKHPNFQALPRQPLQIRRKQCIRGKEEEVVTVHPRALFVPQEGWTFLSADFCQVELRLLAHLSSDPELLRIFTDPQADVFAMLASQWKGMSVGELTPEDREHAKRIVYSIVYGAGRERLSGILGVSAEQASRFQSSFLQTYRDVQAFVQRTIQQSHKQGYVLSIMGRRRSLPNISSPDWSVRMQAERQAVNFVVQGSAADLCKMAMIRIFSLVSSSSSLSARLLAQLHDELLYEVEDSQVQQFAALVKSTMESLQHIDQLGVHLKVPLKVAVSSGKSWGSMTELNTPLLSPPS